MYGRVFGIVGGVVLAIMLMLIPMSCTVISPGTVGVQTTFGSMNPVPIEAGIHLVAPWSSLEKMSVKTHTYVMSSRHDEGQKQGDDSISVLSSNGVKLDIDVAVPHILSKDAAAWVLLHWGKDYEEAFIRQAVQSSMRQVASKYSDEEIYTTKRAQMAVDCKAQIEQDIDNLARSSDANAPKKPVIVSDVMLGKVKLPESVEAAINAKQKMAQEAQAMQYLIAKAKQEAERKGIEADGIALFQKKVVQGVTEDFLKWKALEVTEELAKSPNTKVIIIGTGSKELPVLMGAMETSKHTEGMPK